MNLNLLGKARCHQATQTPDKGTVIICYIFCRCISHPLQPDAYLPWSSSVLPGACLGAVCITGTSHDLEMCSIV